MTEPYRYHTLAIVLHWTMAAGIVFMVGSGWYMVNGELSKAEQFDLYQIHKASGVIMLLAFILRVITRFTAKYPSLPDHFPAQQQKMASLGHFLLYCLLLVIPVAGWAMVSASPFGLPTFVFFDWLKWPHIPGIARNKEIEAIAKSVHWYAVVSLLAVLSAHIGAVVLHKLKHHENLLKRMWW